MPDIEANKIFRVDYNYYFRIVDRSGWYSFVGRLFQMFLEKNSACRTLIEWGK